MGAEGFEPRANISLKCSITYIYDNTCALGCVHIPLHEGADNCECSRTHAVIG